MKSERWYKRQKFRVRKKYVFLLGRYFSPREFRRFYKKVKKIWRMANWEYRMALRMMDDE